MLTEVASRSREAKVAARVAMVLHVRLLTYFTRQLFRIRNSRRTWSSPYSGLAMAHIPRLDLHHTVGASQVRSARHHHETRPFGSCQARPATYQENAPHALCMLSCNVAVHTVIQPPPGCPRRCASAPVAKKFPRSHPRGSG